LFELRTVNQLIDRSELKQQNISVVI